MGNGECVQGSDSSGRATHVCRCDPGWRGERCNSLDLLPVPSASPGFAPGSEGWVQTWGGAILQEPGANTWRGLLGAKRDPKGTDNFGQNSRIIGVESAEGPGGPFKVRGGEPVSSGDPALSWVKAGEELAPKGFRVDMKRTRDGALVFVSSGYASHPDESKRGFGFVLTYSVGGMDGPWEEICVYKKGQRIDGDGSWTWPDSSPKAPAVNYRADASPDNYARRFDCEMSDPTFLELEDGTAIIGYRGTQCAWDYSAGDHFQEVPALLVAPDWRGPYRRLGEKILGDHADAEDMYMWRSKRGVHMLYHHMGKEYGDLYKKVRGGYAFTADKTGLSGWTTTDDEAWPSYLALDNCSVIALGKRQRPSLIFDMNWERPTHLVTGVSTTLDGLTWGDGWTAVQPIRGTMYEGTGRCKYQECPPGQVGQDGDCIDCRVVVDSVLRERCTTFGSLAGRCICTACAGGWLGESCDVPRTVAGDACRKLGDGSGKRLLPGTRNSKYFRCGWVNSDGSKGGWHGHCVPAGALCNGVKNCGDGSDEVQDNCGGEVACEWPLVGQAGVCHPCAEGAIPNCAPGQTSRLRASDECVCQKCVEGWLGKLCDVRLS